MAVSADPIADAARAARRGELIVFPTDTVYGLATAPQDPAATARIYQAKGRARDLALPVLAASVREAREVGVFDERAERLAAACWPGPLTLVLTRSAASADWDLGEDPATVGVRVPRHRLALALLAASGPLAVTSANRSGEPPAPDCDALEATFGDAVSVYLCEEAPLAGLASTVVDLAHGPARLLRAGTLDAPALSRLLGKLGPLLDSPLSS
jgi:L-threonylcarbamoyladenylate synthase